MQLVLDPAMIGVGLSFQPEALPLLERADLPVQCLEIMTEQYLDALPEKEAELQSLARRFPLLPHGLTLSIGSADGLDDAYVRRLARWVERVRPPFYSEHLGFTRGAGLEIGHFAPLPFTREAVEVVVRNARRVRRALGVPLLLENIAALFRLPGAEMDEPEFLTRICDEAGCGLLLDLTNLHANALNLGFDAHAYLDALPHERITVLHLSGGRWEDGLLADSHSTPVPEPVWSLLAATLPRSPIRALILERDGDFGATEENIGDLRRAGEYAAVKQQSSDPAGRPANEARPG